MKPADDKFDKETAARRRDEALKRALMTPPKPHNAVTGKRRKAKSDPKRKAKAKSR